MYKIDKNVPLPEKCSIKKSFNSKYPFAQMDIGDSFLIPGDDRKKCEVIRSRIITITSVFVKHFPGRKFATRLVENGLRVWRIK